jgi:hypothetical protein
MTDTVTAHALVGLFGVTIRTITDQAKRGMIVRAAIGDPSRIGTSAVKSTTCRAPLTN